MPPIKKVPVREPIPPRYTVGRAIPKSSRRARFNPDTNTYSRAPMTGKHAGSYLWQQGIGVIQGPPEGNIIVQDAWSVAFNGPAFGNGV